MTVDDLIDEINIEELYNKVVTCGCCCLISRWWQSEIRIIALQVWKGNKSPSFNGSLDLLYLKKSISTCDMDCMTILEYLLIRYLRYDLVLRKRDRTLCLYILQ